MRSAETELESLAEADLLRRTRGLTQGSGATVLTEEGQELVNFSSNDYLGMSTCPELAEAMARAARDLGSGSGSSRLICGTHRAHQELEERLAAFKSTGAALSFSSGFAAALGTLTTMLKKGDTVILDKLSHASLIDGARLSGATIRVYPHNNLEKLERLLRGARDSANAESRVLVVTESVFSMDGDRSDLTEIVRLKDRYDALLLLDEAHAFGVMGSGGRGLADELGVSERIDLFLGTLSKAAGVSGGFIAADRATVELLKNRSRSFIYTTAPSPAVAATASRAVELLGSAEGERRRGLLWDNITRFASLAGSARPESAIIPHIIGEEAEAMDAAKSLEKKGFLVPAIRYPTVARGAARLRVTLSSQHSAEQVEKFATALTSLEK